MIILKKLTLEEKEKEEKTRGLTIGGIITASKKRIRPIVRL